MFIIIFFFCWYLSQFRSVFFFFLRSISIPRFSSVLLLFIFFAVTVVGDGVFAFAGGVIGVVAAVAVDVVGAGVGDLSSLLELGLLCC
eukprot:NODE_3500_length_662_cov_130.486134_g2494_i0.p1 GENE.NODE_3500_length_662_cov_130.486134_g2494_i0~~NODE_3500_length_662_cov_130.486134_g2494_i0.p1  ORF type:complete len:88 (-),score=8.30 NODE_3500_length_662_cov_130.486134_g2494_i0:87-350(-)